LQERKDRSSAGILTSQFKRRERADLDPWLGVIDNLKQGGRRSEGVRLKLGWGGGGGGGTVFLKKHLERFVLEKK